MPSVILALIATLIQVARPPRIDEVAWLRGCWESRTGEGTVDAQWLSPRASSMLGVSRTIHGTTLIDYEMVVIRERGDRLSYEPHPSDAEAGLFMSTAVSDRTVVFQNLQPRFPARVGYELSSPDRLLAWMDGSENGTTRRVELSYSRVSCPGD
jgi:hypothetical protein